MPPVRARALGAVLGVLSLLAVAQGQSAATLEVKTQRKWLCFASPHASVGRGGAAGQVQGPAEGLPRAQPFSCVEGLALWLAVNDEPL